MLGDAFGLGVPFGFIVAFGFGDAEGVGNADGVGAGVAASGGGVGGAGNACAAPMHGVAATIAEAIAADAILRRFIPARMFRRFAVRRL